MKAVSWSRRVWIVAFRYGCTRASETIFSQLIFASCDGSRCRTVRRQVPRQLTWPVLCVARYSVFQRSSWHEKAKLALLVYPNWRRDFVSRYARISRINSQPFVSLVLEISSILSFSHALAHLEHSWRTLACIGFGERRKRKAGSARKQLDQKIQLDFFLSNRLHV